MKKVKRYELLYSLHTHVYDTIIILCYSVSFVAAVKWENEYLYFKCVCRLSDF